MVRLLLVVLWFFAARVGPSWSRRSEHRDHADRSIVIKKIGFVITGIGASWSGRWPKP